MTSARTEATSQEEVIANGDDVLMRVVLAVTNDAVCNLSQAARAHEGGRQVSADHVHMLAQQIAGVTLDMQRSWPHATD